MNSTIEAIYENGVLRPVQPLTGLAEGQMVSVRVEWNHAESTVTEEEREQAFLRMMEDEGLLVHFPPPDVPPPADFKPLVLDGPPLSQQIIEDRR